MQEEIIFKGSCSGLRVILDNTIAYDQLKQLLKIKLEKSKQFFQKGTVIALDADWLEAAQKQEITELFQEYGLVLTQVKKEEPPVVKAPQAQVVEQPVELPALKTVIINQTIRNGQEVISEGSIVINGNVNPGATVIACGNIEIHGSCRGIVHAGAFGNSEATITADHLIPIQIRIGDLVARAPQSNMSKDDAPYPERAYINAGKIVLEAVAKQGDKDE